MVEVIRATPTDEQVKEIYDLLNDIFKQSECFRKGENESVRKIK